MAYGLGIDVGTTFSAAAIWRDQRVEVVALETHRVTVPTVMFADGDEVAFGTSAVSRAQTHSTGVAREFKRRIGDPVSLVLSGAPYSADRLFAMFARWIVDSVTRELAEAPARVVVTHPANWTSFQLNLVSQALQQVALSDVEFLSEPEAAALDFAATSIVAEGHLVLVYDLGGGTFDVALLRRDKEGFTFVGDAAGVERLGGIDFDEAVFQHVLRNLPADVLTRSAADDRSAFAHLRRACVEAKEELSNSSSVEVPVVLPGCSTPVRLTRAEFEDMIRPMLGQTVDLVRAVVARAGIGADDLAAILLIGGASRTPLVSELVGTALGASVRIDAHPKLVVARGAARRAGAPSSIASAAPPRRSRRRSLMAGAALVSVGLVAAGGVLFVATRDDDESPGGTSDQTAGPLLTVAGVEQIGYSAIEVGESVDDLEIGGVSGIAYDAAADAYYAVSDQPDLPRFYELAIDLTNGELRESGVRPVSATTLRGADGEPIPARELEADAITLSDAGTLYVADEGEVETLQPPSLFEFDLDGTLRAEHPSPEWYHPTADGTSGIGLTGGFSSLDVTAAPDGKLVVGVERSLCQDVGTPEDGLPVIARILVYDAIGDDPVAEFGYPLGLPSTSPRTCSPAPDDDEDRLTELVAVDGRGTVLALESSIVNDSRTVRLYQVRLDPTAGAAPSGARPPLLEKTLIANFRERGLPDAEYQGMTLGPTLADGRTALILVSDNNFDETNAVPTEFLALAVTLEAAPE